MVKLEFSEGEKEEIHYQRYHHPHPRVQQKMEVLWLKSQGESHQKIAQLAKVHVNTVTAYLKEYAEGGMEKINEVRFHRPESLLKEHKQTIEDSFRDSPPSTIGQASATIEQMTGIKRSPTQVRIFLKNLGMKCRKVGFIPAKADPDEQDSFKKKN